MAVIYVDRTNKYDLSLTALNATSSAGSFIDILLYPFKLIEQTLDGANVLKWINEIVITRGSMFSDEMDYYLSSEQNSYDAEERANKKAIIFIIIIFVVVMIIMFRK